MEQERMPDLTGMTETQKALRGLLYDANGDEAILRERRRSQELSYEYNRLRPSQVAEREALIRGNFAHTGRDFLIEQPFQCDFWDRVSIGEQFYANYHLVILAGNRVEIGDHVLIGPDCGIYAAEHPLDAQRRDAGLEYALPIRIGSHVWIGGGVRILSGVTIGDYAVIAAGSVVTRDVPPNVLAGGVPCRVLKENLSLNK